MVVAVGSNQSRRRKLNHCEQPHERREQYQHVCAQNYVSTPSFTEGTSTIVVGLVGEI
jgi:hypothetical protein